VGDILATARYRKREDDIVRPAMATLNAGLSRVPRGDVLVASIRNAVWSTPGPQAVDAGIDAGLRDAIDMLTSELQRKPRFGRIPGKQYPGDTGYAAKESEHGDHAWLRVRDGTLVSLPLSSLD
jgi:hypothetical protein